MDAYIAKPINAKQLFDTIENLLRGRDTTEETPEIAPVLPPALDKAKMLERIGGDRDLLKELAELFTAECPSMLSGIREAVRDMQADALQKAAHALKGSVGNFAAEAAVQAALKLEMMGRNRDMTQAPQALQELEREIDRVLDSMAALVKENEP